MDLWRLKRPLYQLSDNHCPKCLMLFSDSYFVDFFNLFSSLTFDEGLKKDGLWPKKKHKIGRWSAVLNCLVQMKVETSWLVLPFKISFCNFPFIFTSSKLSLHFAVKRKLSKNIFRPKNTFFSPLLTHSLTKNIYHGALH